MQFWHPYALSFLVTSALILSLLSVLDCNFVSLHLPYQVENALSLDDIPLDDGIGIGLFTYEVLSVRKTSTARVNVGLQMQQGIARKRCMTYASAKHLNSGLVDKRKFYSSFANGDSVFTTVKACGILSIIGIFFAALISWISLFKANTTETDYGPRMTYGEVKKSTLRTIGFIVLLFFCLVTEGIKFRFQHVDLCQRHTIEVMVNSTSKGLETSSLQGVCSISRGMIMSITAFCCLCVATMLSLVC
mmetsp:Transcript_2875/g.4347  ORF Transcript_2875/g.4347 Transcript_2875/m.4347 type:complete len:247 (+) Transcript_2875:188-928(+)